MKMPTGHMPLVIAGLFLLYAASAAWAGTGTTISIVFFGSNNGLIESCDCPPVPWGGLSYRKAVVDSLRRSGACDILVDYGNFCSSYTQKKNDRMVADIYARFRFDAVNTGRYELISGPGTLEHCLEQGVPLFSSNLSCRQLPLPEKKVITVRGSRILVAGMCPRVREQQLCGYREPAQRLKDILENDEQYDCVVILSMLSDEDNRALVERFPGRITAVLGNSSRETNYGEVWEYRGTLMALAGVEGKCAGRLVIRMDNARGPAADAEFIPVPLNITPDTEIEKMIDMEQE